MEERLHINTDNSYDKKKSTLYAKVKVEISSVMKMCITFHVFWFYPREQVTHEDLCRFRFVFFDNYVQL